MNTSKIGNKIKRQEIVARLRKAKQKVKTTERKKRQKAYQDAEERGEMVEKPLNQTLESLREIDGINPIVSPDDEEVFNDEALDEFEEYYTGGKAPKILITTRPRPSRHLFILISDIMQLIPNAFFYPRKSFEVKDICKWANEKEFTHIFIFSEKNKECDSIMISHLPHGPTAMFRLTSFIPSSKIVGHGRSSGHTPELILNNFNTRLGRRMGRFMGSLYPHSPEFVGRQVVTMHNQRDFIFLRHHRYIFQKNQSAIAEAKHRKKTEKKLAKKLQSKIATKPIKATLQELGPRFTLKMRWLQQGTFDSMFGEYEWMYRRKNLDTSKRRFHL